MAVGGFKFETVNVIPKELKCTICTLILRDAVELPCSHAFCDSCILQWEKDKTKPCCPECKQEYSLSKKHHSGFLNRFIVMSLDVMCLRKDFGCPWTGKICDYKSHKCQYKVVKCNLEGCNNKTQLRFLEEHLRECKYRIINCQYCNTSLKISMSVCTDLMVYCPNIQCVTKIKRKEIKDHRTTCLYEEIGCPYEYVGLNSGCLKRRKDEEKHQKEYAIFHNELLRKAYVESTSKLSKIVSSQQSKIEDLTSEVKNLKRSMEQHKETLEPDIKKMKY